MRPTSVLTRCAVAAAATAAGLALPAPPASAHPLDQLVQQVYLTPAAASLEVEVGLTPGTLIAAAFARTIDTDGDERFSTAETAAHAVALKKASSLLIDGQAAEIAVTGANYPPYDLLAAGGATITIHATTPLNADSRQVAFSDHYEVAASSIVQMAVSLSSDATLTVGDITHTRDGRTITVQLASGTPARAGKATPTDLRSSSAGTDMKARMFGALRSPLTSPWSLLILIGVCALLGAFHALTPGHGKTLLAAYLVGTEGTPRQAIMLGGVITVMHTSSVLLLGTAVLLAGHYVLPGILIPTLEIAAGAVVLILGVRIARRRWSALRSGNHDHDHSHGHAHDHHDTPGHSHSHGGSAVAVLDAGRSPKTTSAPGKTKTGFREIAGMGVTGGIIPCPEALSILILAVGLHRTALGIAMIVAFSVGLAAILVGLGLVLVTARTTILAIKPAGNRWFGTRLPMLSAFVVVTLGLIMTVNGVLHAVDESQLT